MKEQMFMFCPFNCLFFFFRVLKGSFEMKRRSSSGGELKVEQKQQQK